MRGICRATCSTFVRGLTKRRDVQLTDLQGGYCIRHPEERAHTIEYLEEVKKRVQWKTTHVITALRKQWAELDGHGS